MDAPCQRAVVVVVVATGRYMGLFHAVDWMPTLLTAAGAASSIPSGLDGVAQWTQLACGSGDAAPRTEILHNINIWDAGKGVLSEIGYKWAALRYGDWKLILHENDLCVRCVCVRACASCVRVVCVRLDVRACARACVCARAWSSVPPAPQVRGGSW